MLEDIINEKCEREKKIIQEYIINRCKEDPFLVEKINGSKKTIASCWEYILEEARKYLGGRNGAIEDSQVDEWAVHYFLEDSIPVKPVATPPTKTEKTTPTTKVEAKPVIKEQKKVEGQLSMFDLLGEETPEEDLEVEFEDETE